MKWKKAWEYKTKLVILSLNNVMKANVKKTGLLTEISIDLIIYIIQQICLQM